MPKLVTLDASAHRHLRIDPARVPSLGAAERLVPVVLSEFAQLVVHYPLVFTKNDHDGRFVPVALLGLDENENLFYQNGRWQPLYIPLNVARQPFFLTQPRSTEEEPLICIDPDSRALGDSGEPLFDDAGQPAEYLQNVRQTLIQISTSEKQTRAFTDQLVSLELLMPLSLDITLENGESRQVRGLYAIDEEKLAAIDEADCQALFRAGYLGPIYWMAASINHIHGLIERKNAAQRH